MHALLEASCVNCRRCVDTITDCCTPAVVNVAARRADTEGLEAAELLLGRMLAPSLFIAPEREAAHMRAGPACRALSCAGGMTGSGVQEAQRNWRW